MIYYGPPSAYKTLYTEQLGDPPDHDTRNNGIWYGESERGRAHGSQITKYLEFIGEADQEPANEAPQETACPGAAATAGCIAKDGT